jgi:IS5 family transposase
LAARRAQIDRDGHWTLKRGRKRTEPPDGIKRVAPGEILVPLFGYKNMSASIAPTAS